MSRVLLVPEPGQLVDVRHRRYVVVEVTPSTLPLPVLHSGTLDRQHLVTLSSVEDDALGEDLQVIWEVEPGAATIEKTPLPQPIGFDSPQRLDTFLNAVRWGAASSADVKAVQAPFRSGVDLEDYQLDPVARAVQMPRANLLIADDVGLGKTIEAGLVAQELLIRHRARRILVVCPAALQVQWHDQMRDKFGLEFRIVDSKLLSELRRERGIHVNPWTHFPRLITSIDFLKRERPLRLMSEALPAEGESLYPRKFDLLILDEAHNVAPSGRGKYATDSQRTLAIRRLVPHFEHKLFLSATPHNGYRESFSALLELLDNQRFARGVEPDGEQLNAVMVRRLKSELPPRWDGSPRFPRREITALAVEYTPQERDAHQLLQEYSQSRITESQDAIERYATEFVAKLLKKRLFSSPEAFFATLQQHERSLTEARRHAAVTKRPGEGILHSRVERLEEEHDDDEALDDATNEALEATAPLFRAPGAHERELLAALNSWAERARQRADSKARELISWLHRTLRPNGRWNQERVIIFTEYRATQNWLYGLLAREGFAEKGADDEKRLLMLYGGMDTKTRESIKAAFQADPADASVRILLATDAASEGIDLQNHCSRLIHYEIPWNPNRLEQRNGRIDRHGQRAKQVDIYHFVSSTYQAIAESGRAGSRLDADTEFLWQAVDKIEKIREDLGSVGPVIANQVEEAMLARSPEAGALPRRTLDTRRAEENAPSRRLQAFAQKQRKLLAERIAQLYEQLQEGRRELGLTPENIQAVVETALELAQQPPLQKRTLHDPHGKLAPIEVFDVPALSGSWAQCTDGLEHPHTHERRRLRLAYEEWADNQAGSRPDPAIHTQWLRFVLDEVLGMRSDTLLEGQQIPPDLCYEAREYGETLRPQLVVRSPFEPKVRLLIQQYPRGQKLEKVLPETRWKASPATRMMELLRSSNVRLGLVTNGEHWMLIDASPNETTGYYSWYSTLWLEEPLTLRAFRSLLGMERFFNVPPDETLEALLTKSATRQQEVTDQLGDQVRRAVETLVRTLDRLDKDSRRALLHGITEKELYEAALTVMMRLVVLLSAEEREMLLLGDALYDQNYAVSTMHTQLREQADQQGEEVLGLRYDAWSRLLAIFRIVFGGAEYHDLHLPAYGGHLFDPDRFAFLEGRRPSTSWREVAAEPLRIDNRTVLHLLGALQYLQVRLPGGNVEPRRLSFRGLDIEQIGHVYEGLLDHTARRATTTILSLVGTSDREPETTLDELEKQARKGDDEFIAFLRETTGRSVTSLQKLCAARMEKPDERSRLMAACDNRQEIFDRVLPFAGLLRKDTFGNFLIVTPGSVYVTRGEDRRSTGTHYTPRSLTEPIVQHTLDPLVYIGPAEGLPEHEWQLRPASEILELKVCDMAMGSGAFLVQSCRYLSEKLVLAWENAEHALVTNNGARKPQITPGGQPSQGSLIRAAMTYALPTVIQKRKQIATLTDADISTIETKERLLKEADAALEIVKLGADLIIAIALSEPKCRAHLESVLGIAYAVLAKAYDEALRHGETSTGWSAKLAEFAKLRSEVDALLNGRKPFHWPLEFPEVFVGKGDDAGFAAIMSNPPFQGGKKITGALGTDYRDYLLEHLANGKTGHADLCAYFFLRVTQLVRQQGMAALLATNTIAQGDTREVGLDQIVAKGWTIPRAIPSRKWPGEASLEVAHVWLKSGQWHGLYILNNNIVENITAFLTPPGKALGKPHILMANAGKSFIGSFVLGMGFVLEPEEARLLIAKDPRNKDVLYPFLNGEDLNSRPDQSPRRWVINFHDWLIERAETYPDCIDIVKERVKPERQRKNDEGEFVLRKPLPEKWWIYADKRPALYATIADMERVLVIALTSRTCAFSFAPNGLVFSHATGVFALDKTGQFALLQSCFHIEWAFKYASSMKGDLRYTPSDCFETFPFPQDTDTLNDIGERYYAHRQSIMLARQEGLTKTYNRFHNPEESAPDIVALRTLHKEMDEAVARAYGWDDLALEHGFHQTKQGLRYTISEAARREVLDRLLLLNHQRHEEEVRAGLFEKGAKGKKNSTKGTRKAAENGSIAASRLNEENTAVDDRDAIYKPAAGNMHPPAEGDVQQGTLF